MFRGDTARLIREGALYPHVLDYNRKIFELLGVPLPRPNWPLTCTLDFDDNELGTRVADAIFQASRAYENQLIAGLDADSVSGSLVEFGVYKGGRLGSWLDFLDEIGNARQVYGFDSFEGLPSPTSRDYDGWYQGQFSDVAIAEVAARLRLKERPHGHLVTGWLRDTLTTECARDVGPVAFAMVDVDLYEPCVEALDWVADLLVDGSVLGFDDWTGSADHGETAALFEWAARHTEVRLEFLAAFSWRIYFRVHRTSAEEPVAAVQAQ